MSIKAIRIPKGLIQNDSLICPLKKAKAERVVPQEGHGIPVVCFIKQTVGPCTFGFNQKA